VVKDKSFLWST